MIEAIAPRRQLLTARQVAERLGCSWRTIYRNADMGLMPFGVKIGAMRRWDADELDSWIEDGCKPVRRAN